MIKYDAIWAMQCLLSNSPAIPLPTVCQNTDQVTDNMRFSTQNGRFPHTETAFFPARSGIYFGRSQMKISRIRSQILVLPQEDPLANTPEDPNAARPIVILRVDTDDGIEGIGVTFYVGAMTASLKRAVDDLGALTVGEDPLRVEAIIAKLRAAAGGSGPAGMFTLALSAIDIALWDIRGKALSQPLWKLLGGARQRVPTYASGALRRNLSLDEVVGAASRLKEQGFREMKTQLALPGDTSPGKEVERMQKVREAIGPDIKLMCDINQRWRVEQAIDIGKRVEDAGVGLFWLEDVTTHDDYAGLARVNAA